MSNSVLVKKQVKVFGPVVIGNGSKEQITATVRYDDQCGNGHNTFAITGETTDGSGGCIHDEIARCFPELAPYIKWHLCSSDGPMHYIANTVYLAGDRDYNGLGKERNLDAARDCAVWPDATDEDLTSPGLEDRLRDRLPALMAEFRQAVESLGFVF